GVAGGVEGGGHPGGGAQGVAVGGVLLRGSGGAADGGSGCVGAAGPGAGGGGVADRTGLSLGVGAGGWGGRGGEWRGVREGGDERGRSALERVARLSGGVVGRGVLVGQGDAELRGVGGVRAAAGGPDRAFVRARDAVVAGVAVALAGGCGGGGARGGGAVGLGLSVARGGRSEEHTSELQSR